MIYMSFWPFELARNGQYFSPKTMTHKIIFVIISEKKFAYIENYL